VQISKTEKNAPQSIKAYEVCDRLEVFIDPFHVIETLQAPTSVRKHSYQGKAEKKKEKRISITIVNQQWDITNCSSSFHQIPTASSNRSAMRS